MSEKLEIIVLGSGPSCTTPNLACLTRDESSTNPPCRCCSIVYEGSDDAIAAGGKKNARGNTSAAVRKTWRDGTQCCVLIDCGKTFNRSVVDHFPVNKLRKIDAVILTHDHADATFGCDDLRVFTCRQWIQDSVPVYLDLKTFSILNERFPYLVQTGVGSGTGLKPTLDFKIIEAHKEVTIAGIKFLPFEVQHGTTEVAVPMKVTETKGNHESSLPSTPEGDGQAATMQIQVPYMTLALLIEDKVLWMTDTNNVPDRAWDILFYGLNEDATERALVQPKRKLRLAFIDLADHMMIGRAHLDLRGFMETLDKLEPECTFAIGMNHTLCHGEMVALGQEAEKIRPAGNEDAFIKKALCGDISRLSSDGLFQRIQEKRLHFRPAFDGMTVSMGLEDGTLPNS